MARASRRACRWPPTCCAPRGRARRLPGARGGHQRRQALRRTTRSLRDRAGSDQGLLVLLWSLRLPLLFRRWEPPEKQDYDYDYWHARDLATTMFRDYGQHVFTSGIGAEGGRATRWEGVLMTRVPGGSRRRLLPALDRRRRCARLRDRGAVADVHPREDPGPRPGLDVGVHRPHRERNDRIAAEPVYANEGTAEEEFLGVVTSSLSLEQFEKLLLNDIWGTAYAFMIDIEGEAMVHPRLPPSPSRRRPCSRTSSPWRRTTASRRPSSMACGRRWSARSPGASP